MTLTLVWASLLNLAPQAIEWRRLSDGIEYATIRLVQNAAHGDGLLHVVRVNPDEVEFRAILASEHSVANRTAGEWADREGLVVAMNAGMFETDSLSNVGYLRNGEHANNGRWSAKYQSVFVAGPKQPEPNTSAALIDLDAPGGKDTLDRYHLVIQNLRLIKGAGQNVWKPSHRQWSEAHSR